MKYKPISILNNNPKIKKDIMDVNEKLLKEEIQYLKEVIDFNKRQYQEAMLIAEEELQRLKNELTEAQHEIRDLRYVQFKASSF